MADQFRAQFKESYRLFQRQVAFFHPVDDFLKAAKRFLEAEISYVTCVHRVLLPLPDFGSHEHGRLAPG